ncbi:MAG TPA: phosphomannomutase/phosphoglucomutase, partial [Longimicrobiales bacterium]|nr:phosphomannomutase/phosphoglucomutase [Longimicrobiales bacterium]
MMNGHIFREYDIRGVVAEDLSGDVPRDIGRAFASEVRAILGDGRRRTIVVGHDNRPSSPTLAEGVIAGARAAGVDVIDVGTVPTPVLYFAAETFQADGGLQITGSHNPPEYNGFKMLVAGRALYGEKIQELRRRIESGDLAEGDGG